MTETYDQFLEKKKRVHVHSGFDANINSINLFEFQNYVTNRALSAGKFAVFSGTGTGKTRMQLTWCEAVRDYTNGHVLLLAPIAVGEQTKKQAGELGISLVNIDIFNYEQLHNIDPSKYSGVALDEGSILKNEEGAYRNLIIDSFKLTPYKSVWTATPSPNDPMEIGNYSEFLDVLPRNEMLAMYFVHDGGETSKWRLKGHAQKKFWEWVSSWAIMFQKPSDIGFEQDGFDLPPLNIIERRIATPLKEGFLFNPSTVSATDYNGELRATMNERLAVVAEIVNASTENFIIWIKHIEEGVLLKKLIPGSIEVSGSDTLDYKREMLLGFADNKFRVLITKPRIAGMGLNYQNCHNQVFAAPDFSFESVYQSIRRSWRFKQEKEVNAYVITPDTMEGVAKTFYRKQKEFDLMQMNMTNAANNFSLAHKFNQKRDYKKMEIPKWI